MTLNRLNAIQSYVSNVNFNAMLGVKSGRPMVNWLIKIARTIGGTVTKSQVLVLITFSRKCFRLARASGFTFLVKTLKAHHTNLQQAIGRTPLNDMTPMGVRFARNAKGYPRIIPVLHRTWIAKGSPFHIKLWMSLFSIYRVLEIPGKLSVSSIVDGFTKGTNPLSYLPAWSSFIKDGFLVALEKRFSTDFLWDCLNERKDALTTLPVVPYQNLSSTPTIAEVQATSVKGLLATFATWRGHRLLPVLKDWLKATSNISFLNWFEKSLLLAPVLSSYMDAAGTLGKLGLKEEAAGKVRVFAMVDPITQWVLKPLHDRIFEILRLIPQDGTFDQVRPLGRLVSLQKDNRVGLWSFDLTAATDRIPIVFQAAIMSLLLGAHMANLWMILLVGRAYRLPDKAAKQLRLGAVHYSVGQPMGALTSWAMLALTHHALVQWAAYRADVIKIGEWFEDYAILGDDLVIANQMVASEYLVVMKQLGVGVGLHKSLVSASGTAMEFAKRFIVLGANLSPISLKEVAAAIGNLANLSQYARIHGLTAKTIAAIAGNGFRAIGAMNRNLLKQSSRMRGIILSLLAPGAVNGLTPLDFLSYEGENTVKSLAEESRQSLFDKFKAAMLDKLQSMEPQLAVIKQLVTVDRTRAHYGTVEFPDNPLINQLFERKMVGEELRWAHTLFEYVYREFYLDVLGEVRDVRTFLDASTLSTSAEEWNKLFESLALLEQKLGALPLFDLDQSRKVGQVKVSLPRWLKMWKWVER